MNSADLDEPFVSVVIPVLNAEKHIDRTLSALEAQSYPSKCYEINVMK
jgi:glycosyltransferase involved in cell wall biosynthesis